jgi:transposase
MKTYFGVDYHKRFSYGTIMDQQGHILKQGRFGNNPEPLSSFLGDHAGEQCSAVLEATRNWCVMHDWLEDVTGSVTLAHPMKVTVIAEAKVKTDNIDATTLAHLLRCDLVPSAHVCSPQARIIKNLVRHRMFLVRLQTMTKNRIHVLLDRFPAIRTQWPAADLFSNPARAWLKEIELPTYDRTSSIANWHC